MATKGYTDYEPVEGAYPGVSGDFIKAQQNRRGFGIQNVQTVASGAARKSTSKTLRYIGNRAQSYGKYLQDQSGELEQLPGIGGVAGKTRRQLGRYIERQGKAARVASRAIETGRGVSLASARFQTGIAMSWTGLLNAIAFPFGLLSAGAFAGTAIVSTIEEYIGETATGVITTVTAWAFGVGPNDVWVLAIGLYVLYLFFIITMFAGSYIQLKMGGLEPFGGKAAGAKSLTFLAALLISAVPASTFLPWIFVWLFVVMIYPN